MSLIQFSTANSFTPKYNIRLGIIYDICAFIIRLQNVIYRKRVCVLAEAFYDCSKERNGAFIINLNDITHIKRYK